MKEEFSKHIKVHKLEQVFLYVTSKCNLSCRTCYAQDLHGTMIQEDAMRYLKIGRDWGAWKATIIGGEPTMYSNLGNLIHLAKLIGYSFVRINTNGMFDKTFLNQPGVEDLDVICFSVDGPVPDVNDYIRRGANLNTILENMRYARNLGYEVRVNTTVTSLNMKEVSQIIYLVQEFGASEINLNVIISMGNAINNSYLTIQPNEWHLVYMEIMNKFSDFKIRIKIPPAFSRREDLGMHAQCGHKCVALDFSRLYITPDGNIYPCILFLGRNKPFTLKVFKRLTRNQNYCKFLNSSDTHYLPLCIFYKNRLNYGYDSKRVIDVDPTKDALHKEVSLS